MALTLTQLDYKDWDMLDRFLADAYHDRYILRDRRYSDWYFRNHENPASPNIFVISDGRHILGMLGFMAVQMLWGYTTVKGAWGANWMVRSDHRHGVGIPLLKRLTERFDVVLGQGASVETERIVPAMGFSFYPKLNRYIRVLDESKVKRLCSQKLTDNELDALLAPYRDDGREKADPANMVRQVNGRFDSEFYRPDWSLYPQLAYSTLRSADYLSYRYVQHPYFDYRCYLAGRATSPALAVHRIEAVKDTEITVCRMLEFFFPDSGEGRHCAKALLERVVADAQEAQVSFIDFVCPSSGLADILSEAGFVEEQEFFIPLRFSPIEHGSRPQNLTLWSSPALGPRPPLSQWYITKADGDQDRPNP